jgi:hypothetical protein
VQFVLVADGSFRREGGAVRGFVDSVGAALSEAVSIGMLSPY